MAASQSQSRAARCRYECAGVQYSLFSTFEARVIALESRDEGAPVGLACLDACLAVQLIFDRHAAFDSLIDEALATLEHFQLFTDRSFRIGLVSGFEAALARAIPCGLTVDRRLQ